MNSWMINYRDFDVSKLHLKETLLTVGNGYIATRGAFEDGNTSHHYPGTYLAGGYNRAVSHIDGQELINEDLVNFPNWLPLTFKIKGEKNWFDITKVTLLDYREFLHLKKGILKRFYRIKDSSGRIFVINSIRFLSQYNPHSGGIRYSITSENWTGKIIIRSSIYGNIKNQGVARYRDLNSHHFGVVKKGVDEEKYLYLHTRSLQSNLEVSMVIKNEIYMGKSLLTPSFKIKEEQQNIHEEFEVYLKPFQKISIYKTLSIYHSKDRGISESLYDALKLSKSSDFRFLIKQHISAWRHLWNKMDVEINGIADEQKLIRLHLFHLLQSLSKHSISLDYGAPARGLHGEAYRGHVFWDELFILPFFFYTFPEIARSLLMYRYYRLDAARQLAQEQGYQGAMFPWQSASNGEEETQKIHLNPKSGTWGPDFSRNQRHVNLAIVYNLWNYYLITQDNEFLNEYGAELIFEIAKFIVSMVIFNPNRNKFEIHGVMGPDEYHETEINTQKSGFRNNTYTNIMAVWVLEKALELPNILSPLQKKYLFETLNITKATLVYWKKITKSMFIPFHEGVLSQFEGYESLKEFDWKSYQQKYSFCERLDRILKAENKDPNEYQIAKQPDTLMLFYLLEEKEICRIMHQLGYHYNSAIRARTLNYYLKRTSHGSTLSKITLASILLKEDPELAHSLYQEALISDLQDTQGGTTEEGVHLGVMAGTITLLMRDISGITFHPNYFSLNPHLPYWIKHLKFKINFQQNLYEIELSSHTCKVTLCEQRTNPCRLLIKNIWVQPSLNVTTSITYKREETSANLIINQGLPGSRKHQ